MTSTPRVEHPGGAEPVHASRRPGVEGGERRGARGEAEDEEGAGPAGREDERARAQRQRRRGLGRQRVVPARDRRATSPSCRPGTWRRTRRPRATSTPQIYYDKKQKGSKAAATQLAKLFVPSDVGPLPKDAKLHTLDPGAMLTVVVGETYHNQLVTPAAAAAGAGARAGQRPLRRHHRPRADQAVSSIGCPFTLEVPTVLETFVVPGHLLRRRRLPALLDRPAPPQEGDPARLQDRRRRVLGDRGDEHAGPARPRRQELQQDAQGPRRSPSTTPGSQPPHGRAAGARPKLLGREHAARLALERDDARDREGSQTPNAAGSRVAAMAKVGIFGAGWVGLVTGVCFAELGHEVVVRDVVPEKIEALRLGEVPFHELGVQELLERNRERLTLHPRRRRPRRLPVPLRLRRHAADPVGRRRSLARVERRRPAPGALRARDPGDEVDGSRRDGREDPASASTSAGSTNIGYVSNPEFLAEGTAVRGLPPPGPHRDRRVRGGGRRRGGGALRVARGTGSSAATSTRRR